MSHHFSTQIFGTAKKTAPPNVPPTIQGFSHPIMCISKPSVSNSNKPADASGGVRKKQRGNGSDDDGDDDVDGDDGFATTRKKRAAPVVAKLSEAVRR